MKTKEPNLKYIEWHSPEELHEATLGWLSQLKFIKDEQHFLDVLLEDYCFQLLDTFQQSSAIIQALAKERKDLEPLLKNVIKHYNKLILLLDGINEPIKEKKYKENHKKLLQKVSTYLNDYRETKKAIYHLIKEIMAHQKQKRLLN